MQPGAVDQNFVSHISNIKSFKLMLCVSDVGKSTTSLHARQDEESKCSHHYRAPMCVILESANLTVNDAAKREAVHIWGGFSVFSTAIFVPNCAFQRPEEGECMGLGKTEQEHCKVDACLTSINDYKNTCLRQHGISNHPCYSCGRCAS